jgi:hypothetical protein
MEVYGVSVWEACKPPYYDQRERKPLQCAEMTPQLLAKLKKRIPKWKPDAEWTYEIKPEPERSKGRKPVVLDNADLVQLFDGVVWSMKECTLPPTFEDVFHGVVRLDMNGNTRPLSTTVVYRLLSKLDKLSTAIISDALGVGERQAQRYMQACGLIQLLIRREVVKRSLYNQELLDVQDKEVVTNIEESLLNEYDTSEEDFSG